MRITNLHRLLKDTPEKQDLEPATAEPDTETATYQVIESDTRTDTESVTPSVQEHVTEQQNICTGSCDNDYAPPTCSSSHQPPSDIRQPDNLQDTPSHSQETSVQDGFEVALDNELLVLSALWEFGWLTSRMLALYIWGNQESRMARRTLARLKKNKQVLTRRLPNGCPAYVLSSHGARRLRSDLNTVHVKSGKDIRMGEWMHRAISNMTLILIFRWHLEEYSEEPEIYTEHEIQSGHVPFLIHDNAGRSQWYGKVPDALMVVKEDGIRHVYWVEVENSRKSTRSFRQLTRFMKLLISNNHIAHETYFEKLLFVSTEKNQHLLRIIARQLDRYFIGGEPRSSLIDYLDFLVLPLSPGLKMERNAFQIPTEELLPEH